MRRCPECGWPVTVHRTDFRQHDDGGPDWTTTYECSQCGWTDD